MVTEQQCSKKYSIGVFDRSIQLEVLQLLLYYSCRLCTMCLRFYDRTIALRTTGCYSRGRNSWSFERCVNCNCSELVVHLILYIFLSANTSHYKSSHAVLSIDPDTPDDPRELYQRLSQEYDYITASNSYSYMQTGNAEAIIAYQYNCDYMTDIAHFQKEILAWYFISVTCLVCGTASNTMFDDIFITIDENNPSVNDGIGNFLGESIIEDYNCARYILIITTIMR